MARYQLAPAAFSRSERCPARCRRVSANQYSDLGAGAEASPAPTSREHRGSRQGSCARFELCSFAGSCSRAPSKYAADLGKALDDGDNLRVLPIISYGAVGNVTDLILF